VEDYLDAGSSDKLSVRLFRAWEQVLQRIGLPSVTWERVVERIDAAALADPLCFLTPPTCAKGKTTARSGWSGAKGLCSL
jgi:hypothetical protein